MASVRPWRPEEAVEKGINTPFKTCCFSSSSTTLQTTQYTLNYLLVFKTLPPTTLKQDVSLLLQLLLRQLQLLLLQLLQRKSSLSQTRAIVVTYLVILTSCVLTALSPSASPLSVLAFSPRPTSQLRKRQYTPRTLTNTTI